MGFNLVSKRQGFLEWVDISVFLENKNNAERFPFAGPDELIEYMNQWMAFNIQCYAPFSFLFGNVTLFFTLQVLILFLLMK
jgi:hypothetical protein